MQHNNDPRQTNRKNPGAVMNQSEAEPGWTLWWDLQRDLQLTPANPNVLYKTGPEFICHKVRDGYCAENDYVKLPQLKFVPEVFIH